MEALDKMMKTRSEQLYEIDQILFDQSDPSLQSLYKTKKTKKSPLKKVNTIVAAQEENTESPSPVSKKKGLMAKINNPRAFLQGVFPGDDDAKAFDKMERI